MAFAKAQRRKSFKDYVWMCYLQETMIRLVILTSHPELHRKSAVLKYTMSDHFLIYTHIEFKDTKSPTVDHNTVKFRDTKNFDAAIFAHGLMSCSIFNGSQDA